MKKILIALSLVPTLSFASIYNCSGAGFSIELLGNPVEMRIYGNGFNTVAQNVRVTSTFDTVVSANTVNPVATIKLTIKDSSYGNPGDAFSANLQLSSSAGVQTHNGLTCVRGND